MQPWFTVSHTWIFFSSPDFLYEPSHCVCGLSACASSGVIASQFATTRAWPAYAKTIPLPQKLDNLVMPAPLCPFQRQRPRLILGQIGLGAFFQQPLHHLLLALARRP